MKTISHALIFGLMLGLAGGSLPGCTEKKVGKGAAAEGTGKRGKRRGRGGGAKGAKGAPTTSAPAAPKVEPPTLPDLPKLEAQQKLEPEAAPAGSSKPKAAAAATSAKPSAGAAPADEPCGVSTMGDRTVALECIAGSEAPLAQALKPVVNFTALKADDALLEALVDHRSAEAPVADEGKAPIGSALALAGAIDHAVAGWANAPGHVSAMSLWARYHEPSLAKGVAAILAAGAPADEAWPFVADDAASWLATCGKGSKCGKPVDAEKRAAADAKPYTTAPLVEDVGTVFDAAQFRSKLAAGEDVLVALKVGPTFGTLGAAGAKYVPHYESAIGVHALLVTGYARLAHGTYFLLRNSVGDAWGDHGYAWIHEATLKANLAHAYVVDARPTDEKLLKRPLHADGKEHCKARQLPDSVTGLCVGVCSDKSPRAANVCSAPKACPKGYANLTGVCVPGAPTTRADKTEDIRFFCGPGGCFYRIAKGVLGCEKDACTFSCPSPTFRAMRSEKEFVCWQ